MLVEDQAYPLRFYKSIRKTHMFHDFQKKTQKKTTETIEETNFRTLEA